MRPGPGGPPARAPRPRPQCAAVMTRAGRIEPMPPHPLPVIVAPPPGRRSQLGPGGVAPEWDEPYRASRQPSFTEGVVVVEHVMHATWEAGFVRRWGIGGCVGVLAALAAWLPAPAARGRRRLPQNARRPGGRSTGASTPPNRSARASPATTRTRRQPVYGPDAASTQVKAGFKFGLAVLGDCTVGPGGRATRASSATARSRPESHPGGGHGTDRNQGNRGRQRPRDGAALRRHRVDLGGLGIRRARDHRKGLRTDRPPDRIVGSWRATAPPRFPA